MENQPLHAVPEPPAGLVERILFRIRQERRRRFLIKAWAFGAAFAASVCLAVYGSFAAAADASRSGFLVFSSLLFTDFSATIASFSDFLLSIAESFPVFSTVLFLCGTLFAIWSAARLVDEVVLMRRGLSGERFPGLARNA